jgi:hypothetical protein
MREMQWDQPKPFSQVKKELGKVCSIPGCGKPLTTMLGPGSESLCRDHQLNLVEYGGVGKIDRPHSFHRKWECDECGMNVLELPQLQDVEDKEKKRQIARYLMHGDHQERQSDGGGHHAENIRSLCVICHAKKTMLNEDYRKGRKEE